LVTQCRDELITKGSGGKKACAPATTVRYLAALSHVFTVAVNDWEWAESNPVKGVRKPKEPCGRDRYLLDEERERLLTACKASKSKDLYTFVVLALATGMRRGEIAWLEWRDVDFARGVITLRDSKNGTRRGIPLRGPIVKILKTRAGTRQQESALVFPGDNPKKPIDLTTPWRTALAKSGVEDFRFHDLRHTAASYLAMNNASSLEIAGVLGHKTLQMTKRYSHLSVDHLGAVMERVNERMFGHA
jgi:integrase